MGGVEVQREQTSSVSYYYSPDQLIPLSPLYCRSHEQKTYVPWTRLVSSFLIPWTYPHALASSKHIPHPYYC